MAAKQNIDWTARVARIWRVYAMPNGMLAVFDAFGKQMPEFQGETHKMLPFLRSAGWDGSLTGPS